MLAQQYQTALRQNPLFSNLNEGEFTQIIAKTSLLKLAKSQVIFQENQLARDFFLVLEGQIKLACLSIHGDEKIVEIISAGNTFAEAIMFLRHENYPLNATALEESSVLRIDANCYLDVLKKSPESCFHIMAQLSQKLHRMVGEISNLKLHDGTYRLIHFLLNNAQQTQKLPKVLLPVSKHDLASRLSIRPETLSRIFKKLSAEGLLETHHDYITLLKPLELKNKLEF